ncbi:MAG: ABC transporter permease [Streptosporangiales bacterium]|nr:ABC transporter permease [Streptosporangiales bacterium]
MKVVGDTGIVLARELRPALRDPFSLAFSLIQPLVFLGLFGPLLSDMPGLEGVGDGTPWQWFVPGILVMLGLSSTSMSGYNLLIEAQTGSHERMLVTPLSRSAMLIGRALKEIAPLLVQALLIIALVMPFGFRFYPLGALVGMFLLATLGVGLGALSYALAIVSKDREWLFYGATQTLLFPLLILSGMLLPLDMGPAWMRAVGQVNPLTYVVEGERALFAGDFGGSAVLYGAMAAFAMAVVGLVVGTRTMRRAAA